MVLMVIIKQKKLKKKKKIDEISQWIHILSRCGEKHFTNKKNFDLFPLEYRGDQEPTYILYINEYSHWSSLTHTAMKIN